MAASAIAIEAVSKRFGGTQALDDVSLALSPGAVHAVVGENGAGKSTLIKILGGVVRPDQGRVLVAGRPQDFQSPADALAAGIAAVSQDVRVVPGLTVAENVMLGHLPARRALGLLPIVDRRRMRDEARAALARLNFDPDLDQPAGALTYAGRQLMAIARALSQQARVLILDEPTAALERRGGRRVGPRGTAGLGRAGAAGGPVRRGGGDQAQAPRQRRNVRTSRRCDCGRGRTGPWRAVKRARARPEHPRQHRPAEPAALPAFASGPP